MFFPQGFMTASMQMQARKTKIAIDDLMFQTRVTSTPAIEGAASDLSPLRELEKKQAKGGDDDEDDDEDGGKQAQAMALMQQTVEPIDRMPELEKAPDVGINVHGLYLQGCGWKK